MLDQSLSLINATCVIDISLLIKSWEIALTAKKERPRSDCAYAQSDLSLFLRTQIDALRKSIEISSGRCA